MRGAGVQIPASPPSGTNVNPKPIYIGEAIAFVLKYIEELPAWDPALWSKTAIRTTPKRCFVGSSISTAIMRLTPQSVLDDFNTFGYLFESLCTRDLRVYSQSIDGAVYHYRDKNGLEADCIVHLNDGRWGAIEVKLGSRKIGETAEHLKILRDKVDANKMKAPSFLMVLTGTEYAYKREDDVLIVPIGCLKD